MPPKLPIAVLISGNGSNLQALIDASHDPSFGCSIVGVVSDRADAFGLTRAEQSGLPTAVVERFPGEDRDTFTSRIVEVVRNLGADAMVLAGFMRILGPAAMQAFPDAIINVHPSLLPDFPGARAIEQALEAGVSETGVTVHFVDELVDHGPIIAQEPVPILDGDDPALLRHRIQEVEHRLLPEVVSAFGNGTVRVRASEVEWTRQGVAS